MSKIAILSDIHANLLAFEAVLEDAEQQGVNDFAILGDTADYDGNPQGCMDRVMQLNCPYVIGNCDEDACSRWRRWKQQTSLFGSKGEYSGLLTEEHLEWLYGQPYSREIPGAVIAHACLPDPHAFEYLINQNDARDALMELYTRSDMVGFFGHTHVQRVFHLPAKPIEGIDEDSFRVPPETPCAVTVGSVGKPRQQGDPAARWVLWNPEESIVEFRRTPF